jgi:hypothetical protein
MAQAPVTDRPNNIHSNAPRGLKVPWVTPMCHPDDERCLSHIDRPIAETDIEALHAEAFRDLENRLNDCVSMARIAAEQIHNHKTDDRELVFCGRPYVGTAGNTQEGLLRRLARRETGGTAHLIDLSARAHARPYPVGTENQVSKKFRSRVHRPMSAMKKNGLFSWAIN